MRQPVRNLRMLWERLVFARMNPRKHIKFGLYNTEGGFIGGHSQNTGLCCDMWNMRQQIEAAAKLAMALQANPDFFIKLEVASCTCMTKTPDAKFHADDCVYAAAHELWQLLENKNGQAEQA